MHRELGGRRHRADRTTAYPTHVLLTLRELVVKIGMHHPTGGSDIDRILRPTAPM